VLSGSVMCCQVVLCVSGSVLCSHGVLRVFS